MSSKDKQKKTPDLKQDEARGPGQPTKYKPEFCEQLVKHMALPASFESFAGSIDVDRDTLYEWRKKHKDFSDAHKRGKMKALEVFEKTLRLMGKGQIKGNVAAVLFHMKNLTTFRDEPVNEDEGYDGMEFNE